MFVKARRAFTLAEAMVGLFLLSIILGVVAEAIRWAVRSHRSAEAKRQADAAAAQQMQQSALAEQQSNTARNLAQSPTDGDTALSGIMSAFTGYDAPTGA